jgi:tetratricopeptide (TPR) repeat protein
MQTYQRLLLVFVGIAVCAFVIFKELNPPRKVAPVRYYSARVVSAGAQINGQTMRFILDTGSNATRISKTLAGSIGLNIRLLENNPKIGISEPVYLTFGGHTFMAPLVAEDHVDRTAEGLIGWPAIRDNVLIFNPDTRTVISVTAPALETSSWFKFKVLNVDLLELETPLPNGKKGTILVDTGSASGITLATPQWKEWRAMHPQTLIAKRPYTGPEIGNGTSDEAWADQVQIGTLTLTDMPVREAPQDEAIGINNFIGVIGLYALTRMDLVVDAKNDVAYIHPREAPGPPYPPYQRSALAETNPGLPANGDWTLDRSVQTNAAVFFVDAAKIEFSSKTPQHSLADLNQAIEIDPNNAEAYSMRGIVEEIQNDLNGASADFTHGIDLDPKHAGHSYFDRGFASELKGNFEDALVDYNKAIDLNSDFYVAYLRRQVLLLRLHRSAEDFAETIAEWNSPWDKALGGFLTGNLNEEELIAAASKGSPISVQTSQCEANYFIGMLRLIKGDAMGAREYWQKSLAIKTDGFNAYQLCAHAELARLDNPTK